MLYFTLFALPANERFMLVVLIILRSIGELYGKSQKKGTLTCALTDYFTFQLVPYAPNREAEVLAVLIPKHLKLAMVHESSPGLAGR